MSPFSNIAKRVLLAGSVVLLAACGSNGPTDPTEATRSSGYITVSAAVAKPSGYNVPAISTTTTTTVKAGPVSGGATTNLGYNVPAN